MTRALLQTAMTLSEFVAALYQGAQRQGFVEIRAFDKGGKLWRGWQSYPTFPEHPDLFNPAQVPPAYRAKVYYGVALRKEKGNRKGIGGKGNCAPGPVLYAELDLKDEEHAALLGEAAQGMSTEERAELLLNLSAEALAEVKARLLGWALARCDELGLPLRMAVDSGHGLHLYWARRSSSSNEDTERYLKALVEPMRADRASAELARVLRPPGTFNTKNPERPLPVNVVYLDPDAFVEREALEALVKPEPVRVAAPTPTVTTSSQPTSGEKWAERAAKRRRAEVAAAVSGEAGIMAGTIETGRNNQLNVSAVKLARFLPHGELEESELVEALVGAARAAGLDEAEIMPTIRSGISKGTQDPADPQRFDDEERGKAQQRQTNLVVKARAAQVELAELPAAADIPAPELPIDDKGKLDYSDAQVLELLGMGDWGVVSPHSEQAHAIRLKTIANGDLLYVPGKDGREWHVWNSRHWRAGAGAVALAKGYANKLSASLAPETARLEALSEVLDQAERPEDAAAMKRSARRHVRAAKAVEENKRQRAVFDLSSVHFLSQKDVHELFALRPWVLGFSNGTLEGDTFREHRREDYMLSVLRLPYGETWQGGEWEELLGRMTGGDTELAQTLQDVAGYVLSGSSSQRVVFLAYGPASSGKSTFTALLETVLGDQANAVEPKHLSGEGVRGLLGSRLWGRRLGVCHEAGTLPINSELLKTMSGGDSFTVKHLYTDEFTAQPTHALILVANDPPRLDGLDPALRERVVALPFDYDLDPEGRRDLFEGRELKEERVNLHSALTKDFTAWATQGMRRVFLSRRIYLAPAVAVATAKLWADMGDELTGFWETLKTSEISLGVGVRELRGQYVDWCGANGMKPLPARKWDRACEAVGLEKKSNGQAWVWKWSRPGVPWPFDNLTAFTNSQRVSTEKFEGEPEKSLEGGISHREFAGEIVKSVKPSSEVVEDAPRKVVF